MHLTSGILGWWPPAPLRLSLLLFPPTRSHAAVVAAVTAAETFALLAMEDPRYQFPLPSDHYRHRSRHAIGIATNTAVAAKIVWPSTSLEWVYAVVVVVAYWALVTVLWWAIKVVAALIVNYSQQSSSESVAAKAVKCSAGGEARRKRR